MYDKHILEKGTIFNFFFLIEDTIAMFFLKRIHYQCCHHIYKSLYCSFKYNLSLKRTIHVSKNVKYFHKHFTCQKKIHKYLT